MRKLFLLSCAFFLLISVAKPCFTEGTKEADKNINVIPGTCEPLARLEVLLQAKQRLTVSGARFSTERPVKGLKEGTDDKDE